MFFGAGSFTVSTSSKSSISCQGIRSLDHLKSLSKNTYFFRSYPSILVISTAFKYAFTENKFERFQYVFAQLAGPVIMRFLFLPLAWISKSLILVANCKVSILLSRRTPLARNHWPEQPSTQSKVKCVFTVSIRDTLLTSSFSLADSICQVLVTGSRISQFVSQYEFSIVHLASSFPLHSNSKESSVASDEPFPWINSAKSRLVKLFRFFPTPHKGSSSTYFIFVTQAAWSLEIDFLVCRKAAFKSPGGLFSLWYTSWSLLQTYLYVDI